MQTSDLKATGDMSLDVVFDTVASRMRQKPGELGCVGGVFKADHLQALATRSLEKKMLYQF
jgi:hypothetical protein